MAKITKRLQELTKKIDSEKNYVLNEAVDVVKTFASAKFDETVEIALKLNVDPRHADQMVRTLLFYLLGQVKKCVWLSSQKMLKPMKHKQLERI